MAGSNTKEGSLRTRGLQVFSDDSPIDGGPIASEHCSPAPLVVYRPGTIVLIGGPSQQSRSQLIEARIASVMIAGSGLHVRYNVAWYEGSARLEDWIEPEEIVSAGPAEDIQIGFSP